MNKCIRAGIDKNERIIQAGNILKCKATKGYFFGEVYWKDRWLWREIKSDYYFDGSFEDCAYRSEIVADNKAEFLAGKYAI